MKAPIVRFAPSPTGYLHIGGARTAVFNWLFARRHGGKFILRIEDTDADRSTAASIEGIVESLKWLGIGWDEGPCFQSRFAEEHRLAAQRLLDQKMAYRCFCSSEQLEQKREQARAANRSWMYDGTCRKLSAQAAARRSADGEPFTIRLKVPRTEGQVGFQDAVCGSVEVNFREIEDFVLVRSNGQPLYVLSNAVDDIRDGITHVIRGQDGLANTPKQILIYQALGAPLPVFAHMSLTLDPQRAKISKRRHGERVAIHYWRQCGFLPWAMVNFLVLLGWSTSDAKEIFTPEELTAAFGLEGISRSNCVLDLRDNHARSFADPKALSINTHYLRSMPVADLLPHVREQLVGANLWKPEFEGDQRLWVEQVIDLARSRFQLTSDFVTLGGAYFSDDFPLDPPAVEKHLKGKPEVLECLQALATKIEQLSPYDTLSLEKCIRQAAGESQLKVGALVNAIRTAVSGQAVGPDFLEMLVVMGQEKVARRLADVHLRMQTTSG